MSRAITRPETDAKINDISVEKQTISGDEALPTILISATGFTVSMGSPDGTRKYRIKVRVVCSRPYHALFMHTMLIRPTKQQLAELGKPEFVIYNAGAFPANSLTAGMGSKMSIGLSLEDHEMVILGTEQRSRRARTLIKS